MKADLFTGVAVLAGAGALYATGLPQDDGMALSIAMDPAWYPRLLLIMALCCGGGLIAASLLRGGAAAGAEVTALSARVLGGLAAITLYVVAFWFLGYWVATLAFVPIFSAGLGYRRPLAIAAVTLLVGVCVWLVFTQALQIPLTTGPWPGGN